MHAACDSIGRTDWFSSKSIATKCSRHKEAVLSRLRAKPTCDRRIVRADLAGQWTEAMVRAGFASNRPSAFLIEGLLMYLDEPAVAKLFADIKTVASEGSWMGVDLVSKDLLTSDGSPY